MTASNAAAAARALSAQSSTLCRLCATRDGVQEELVVFAVPSGVAAQGVVRAWQDVLARRACSTGVWSLVVVIEEAVGVKPVVL